MIHRFIATDLFRMEIEYVKMYVFRRGQSLSRVTWIDREGLGESRTVTRGGHIHITKHKKE